MPPAGPAYRTWPFSLLGRVTDRGLVERLVVQKMNGLVSRGRRRCIGHAGPCPMLPQWADRRFMAALMGDPSSRADRTVMRPDQPRRLRCSVSIVVTPGRRILPAQGVIEHRLDLA